MGCIMVLIVVRLGAKLMIDWSRMSLNFDLTGSVFGLYWGYIWVKDWVLFGLYFKLDCT